MRKLCLYNITVFSAKQACEITKHYLTMKMDNLDII